MSIPLGGNEKPGRGIATVQVGGRTHYVGYRHQSWPAPAGSMMAEADMTHVSLLSILGTHNEWRAERKPLSGNPPKPEPEYKTRRRVESVIRQSKMLNQADKRIESLEQRRANILAGLQPFPSATEITRNRWATMRQQMQGMNAEQRKSVLEYPESRWAALEAAPAFSGLDKKEWENLRHSELRNLHAAKIEEMEQLESMIGLLKATAEPVREGLSEFVTEDELIAFGEENAA
jgi:hypothetical protein